MSNIYGMPGLAKPIKIEMHRGAVIADTYYTANADGDVDFDVEDVTDYAISEVLPLSYDGEYNIDSSFRFLDSNNG